MAQLVEQLIRNQQVAGSNPAISSKKTVLSYLIEQFFIQENKLKERIMDKSNKEKTFLEIVDKVYDDALSPALKETGGFFSAITGFFNNVVAAPLHRLNASFKIKTEAYINNLHKRYLEIPDENKQEPSVNIVGPTLEALKYNLDEEDLKEMFTNLLLNAMDKTKCSKCHTSFVEIIKQLDSIDATVLNYLSKYKIGQIPMVSPKCNISLSFQGQMLQGYTIANEKFPDLFIGEINSLDIFAISRSLYNLGRLGIIKMNYVALLNDFYDNYKQIEGSEKIKELFLGIINGSPEFAKSCKLSFDRGQMEFTEFGRDFVDCVIQSKENI